MPDNRRREGEGEHPPETPDAETDEEVRVSRRAIEEMQAENERLKEYLQRSMQGGMQAYDNDAVNRSVMMQYAGPTAQGPGLLSEDQRRGYAGLWYALLAGSEGDDDEDNPLYILMSKADAPGDLIANIIRLKMKSTWARRAFSLPRERKTIFDVVIKSVLAGSIGKDRMGRSEFVDIMVQNRMPVEKSEKTQQRGGFWSRIASGR
jgi:hypothetical protein